MDKGAGAAGVREDLIWHPYTRHSAVDAGLPVMKRGEGIYLWDQEGRRYVDAISSWWACNLGHGHLRVVEAIRRQAGELQHSILGHLSHPRALELAERLCGLFPDRRRVLFASDGSSAVEAALKIALHRAYSLGETKRCKFVALEGAYHGDTLGAVAVGYLEHFHRPFKPVLFPVYQAEAPCCSTCARGTTPDRCAQECLISMREIIRNFGPELAAVIVEPLCLGAGGMKIYSSGYLARLAELCAEHDILLIADEVAVGMGRTGRMLACNHADVAADIVCMGKGLAAGYLPLSATIVKEEIYELFRDTPRMDLTFYHGHTFSGNPIAAAAALETLRVYEEEQIVRRAERMGERMARRMRAMTGQPGVRDVRTLGMIGAVELTARRAAEAEARATRIRDHLRAQGVLIRPLGPVVYLMPPLTIDEAALDDLVDRLAEAVAATEDQ